MSKVLAVDTSCDDSSVAVIENRQVISNIVSSQNQIHKKYGGVFPTLAKQAHKENIDPAIALALKTAQINFEQLDALAVTVGPGLAPALEVGIEKIKELAKKYHKKIIAINHIEAHALSPLATSSRQKTQEDKILLPSLALIISGGHSEFVLVKKIGNYEKIGKTIDDAAGECLDKVGRLLNLGYPAAPLLEKFAKKGQKRFEFPMAMTAQANFDLSFSGLKTAARNLISELEEQGKLDKQAIYDLAFSIQEAVFDQITYKLERILLSPDLEKRIYPKRDYLRHLKNGDAPKTIIEEIWLGGGVSANITLRKKIRKVLNRYQKLSGKKINLKVPYSKKLCGDNAAMIGLVANFKLAKKEFSTTEDLDRKPNLAI